MYKLVQTIGLVKGLDAMGRFRPGGVAGGGMAGDRSSAAGGAAALLVCAWGISRKPLQAACYGRAWTCGPTALDQALPAVASQLVD
ncbi:hypothetical protein P3L51_06960, partial [Streptomyces sp. PSRA5]|uniref:hypothetical protein n=1 Tax=Streptomyces panacea TaxID=3035064 RepID=UPI00339C1C8D